MTTIVADQELERRLRRHRRKTGASRWDEVWDKVYVMSPLPNLQHQQLVGRIYAALAGLIDATGRGQVFPGVNVSDQPKHWKRNYRCPDVAVYLNENPAENCGTHWYGGPDLAVEVVSPGEDPHAKLGFYAKVKTRELLVVHRDPWKLELLRYAEGELKVAGTSAVEESRPGEILHTESVPFTWQLVAGKDRPRIEMICTENGQTWHA